MNSIHDIGGMDGFGVVNPEKDEPIFHERWEGRMRALSMLINKRKRLYFIDESRHCTERIHPLYYLGASYYQLWLLRFETMIKERGVLTEEEIQAKMELLLPGHSFQPDLKAYREVRPHYHTTQRRNAIETTSGALTTDELPDPRFALGTVVKTKRMAPLGHTRIPRYVRGKQGVIEAFHGHFVLPDLRVSQGISHYQPVYRVCFDARELWGLDAPERDKLYIEMWEDYLLPADS